MDSMAMQGKIGEAQEGDSGMQMGGAHAQHGVMMGAGGIRHGALSAAQNPQLMMAQQNLADHIRGGLETVSSVTGDLYSAAELPLLGEDSVSVCMSMQVNVCLGMSVWVNVCVCVCVCGWVGVGGGV